PVIAKLELDAGIHTWIVVAEAGARNMHGVGGEGDRSLWLHKIIEADTELGSEVPDAGASIGREEVGRIFVVGPEQSASALHPGDEPASGGEIPAQNNRSEGDAGKCAAAIRQIKGLWLAVGNRVDRLKVGLR